MIDKGQRNIPWCSPRNKKKIELKGLKGRNIKSGGWKQKERDIGIKEK